MVEAAYLLCFILFTFIKPWSSTCYLLQKLFDAVHRLEVNLRIHSCFQKRVFANHWNLADFVILSFFSANTIFIISSFRRHTVIAKKLIAWFLCHGLHETAHLLPWLLKSMSTHLEEFLIATSAFRLIIIQSTVLKDIKILNSHGLENNRK